MVPLGFKRLIENVDKSWSKSILLVNGPRPQPEFLVGLQPAAFTSDQLKKLQPHIGDRSTVSRLVGTQEMYFSFLTTEVNCGNEARNIADRHNAHRASAAAQLSNYTERCLAKTNFIKGSLSSQSCMTTRL